MGNMINTEHLKEMLSALPRTQNPQTIEFLKEETFAFFSSCEDCKEGDRRCCYECASIIGHLKKEDDFLIASIEEYVKCFDEKDGFWTSQGCALPRKLRSYKCLSTYCKVEGEKHPILDWMKRYKGQLEIESDHAPHRRHKGR